MNILCRLFGHRFNLLSYYPGGAELYCDKCGYYKISEPEI